MYVSAFMRISIQSIPGGFNALQRMYRDYQEPMMNAAQSLAGNPFASLVNSGSSEFRDLTREQRCSRAESFGQTVISVFADSGSDSAQRGRENSDPLPNPWGSSGGGGGGGRNRARNTTTSTTNASTPTTNASTTSTNSTSSTPQFGTSAS